MIHKKEKEERAKIRKKQNDIKKIQALIEKLDEEIAAKKSFDEELNKIKSDYDNAKFNFITCRQRVDDLKKQIESFDNIENIEQKVSDCNRKRKENAKGNAENQRKIRQKCRYKGA